jgi:hypothetical protein
MNSSVCASYRSCILLALAWALFSVCAWPQTQLANVFGTVTDPTGAVVPGVAITITRTARYSAMMPGLTAASSPRWRFVSVAFVFPGQGSQTHGMLHDLMDHPAVARTLEEVSDALGSDVRELDREDCLESDVAVQVSLLAAGVATARALTELDIRPAAVSGLSVGAFAAAVIAGVFCPCRMPYAW